ncbi:hypothetical protein COZ73_01690, partial [Candidatus Falkowbacteria bacterium CG_4_8_14_3_um_filter_36_11]
MPKERQKNLKKALKPVLLLAFVLAVLIMPIKEKTAEAEINPLYNFTGKVTNTDGSNVADGVYDMSFYLHTSATSTSSIWSESIVATTTFSAAISIVDATPTDTIIYTYTGEAATTTLRVGQYLYNASTSQAAL